MFLKDYLVYLQVEMPETGVKGLLKFIVNHPETREKTSISQLQQKVWTKTRKKPLLLCDYYAVITWILSRGDRLAIQRKRLSAYSLLFGGNFLCYSVMFRKLVESLQRLGVQPLFFVDSAPGSNEDEMRATFYELKERHLEELEQNHVIQQVCDGKRDILRVPWRLREAISIEVEMLLRSMAIPLIHCNGDADLSIVQYSRLHEEVCGVLSTDTIFATVPSIQLLHMDFFDPDNCLIVSAEDNMADSVMGPGSWPAFSGESDHFDIPCEVTSAEMLARVLGIGANQLVDLSILCGNSYTRELNRYMSTWALLGLADLGVETVAEWLSHEMVPLPSNAVVKGICTQVPAYHEAITHSYRVYKGFGQPDLGHQATSFGVPTLAMAGFAYWRPVVVEATTLGHPCISDLTLPIRKVWYALLGLKRVVEYGRVGNKTFAELVVTVGQDGTGPLHIVQGLSLRERIGCLFFVLTLGHHWLERGESLMTILSHSLGAGRTLKEPISCQGILVCTSLRLMAELNSKGQPSPSIRISELEALIVTCLLCCAGVPPCHTTSLPSMRAITIASWFTSIMEHAYHTAYLLCLFGELPSPSRCFYSLAYVPFHVATVNQNHSNPTSDVGPNLLEAQRIFGHVINLPSALTLRSFILNKSHQYELQHVLDIFAVAVREVSENRSVLTPREGLNMTLPIEMGYEFDGKAQGESAELLDEQATDSSLTHDQDNHIESYCFESLSGLHDSEILSDEEEVASITNAEAPQEAIRHKCPSLPDENEQTAASACTSPVGKKRRKGAVRLPVMDHRESITELLGKYRVICIQGETGCGKSTKVPQFILDDALSATPPKACKILVSQPRRVAAIKLAERVAAERHESLGRTVGFAVAGEKKRGADTAIIYCTTGYLLQMLIHDPFRIEEYTHIILDEIHERNIDADFAMLVVRKLVSDMPRVKVVLMSATMQVDLIVRYFQEVFGRLEVSVPYFVGSKLFPVETFFLDELGVLAEKRKSCDTWHPSQMKATTVMKVLVAEANRYAMPLHCKPEVTDYMRNLCTEIIVSQATLGESILVFLPGMGDIVTYFERLSGELRDRELLEHFSLFMLHSQIPLQEQREAFVVPPAKKVHLILATNIAESSVTVPKLTLVINFGIYRQLEYNSKRHITCLSHRWCSHASCSQRAGRVGRVCAGTAVHLVTREFYNAVFPEHDLAAMATAPLSKLVLQAKQIGSKVGVPSVTQLLSLAVEPPSLQQLEAALQDLVCMGAIGSAPGVEISEDAPITLLGQMSLSLPVELPLSRLVFLGVLFGCVCDAVVLAAALSLDQDVFTLPSRLVMEDRKYHASLLRSMEWREYYDGSSYSEPIAVYRMFRQFLQFKADAPRKKGMSRCAYTRLFSQNVAVRYDRLLQLESVVGDISNRMLGHVERDSTARGELSKLALLVFSHPGGNAHSMLRFCDDPDFLKALLVTSFCHQTVFGVTECNSCFKKERAHAVELFSTIKELGLDYTRTLAFKNLHNVSQLDLDTAARHILPLHHCQTLVTKKTGFIQVNESFDSNPKTKLLRSVAAGLQNQEGVDTSVVSGDGVWGCGGVVVSRPISSELRLLWQYGERHITWKARPDAAELTRPAHPCNVAWYRMNVEKERVIPGSWRNVAGFVCELDPCETPFFAVPFMLQGTCNGPSMAAKGLTVLPSLKHSPRALQMLLSSQPLGTGVDLLVDKARGEVVGARVNSCLVMFEHHKLTPTDMLKINLLRMLISCVVSTVSSEAVIPGDKATAISWVVQDLLSGTLDLCHALKELPQTENYEPAAQALEPVWEVASSKPSDTAVMPAAPLEGCPPQKKVFELFPPLSCSLVKQSTLNEACSLLLQSVGSTSGEAHQGVLEPTVVCTQDPGVSFRLSPSAPPFTPIFTHGNSAVHCDPLLPSVPAVTSPIPSSSSFPKLPVFSCVNSESPPAAHEVKRLLLSPPPASTHFHHSTPPPPVPLRASPGFHTSVPFPPVVSNPFQLPRSTPTSPLLPCGGVCTEADRVAILQKVLELRALQTYWSQQQPNPASPSRHTSSPLLLNPHIAEVQAAMRLFASLPQLAAAACPAVPPSPNGSQPPARPRASGVYPSPSQVTPQQALQQWLRSSQPVGGMPMVSPQRKQDWDPSDAQPASVPASPVWSGNQRPSSQGDVSDNLDRSLSAESSQNLSPCSSVSTGSPRLAASQLEEQRLVKFMMDYIASHGNCVNFDQLCKDAYPSFKRKYSIANDELALTWHFFVRHPKIFAVFGYPGYCMVQLLVRHSSGGSVTEPTLLEPTSSEVISLEPTSSEVISLEPASSEVILLEPTSSEVTLLEPTSSEVTSLEPTSSEVTSLEPTSSEVTSLEPTSSEVTSLEPTSSEVTSLEPTSSEVTSLEPASSEVTSLEPTSSEAPLVNKSGVMNCWPQGTVRLMEEEEQCIEKEVQLVQEEQSEEVQLVQEEHEEVQLVQEEQSEEVQLVQEEQSEEVQLVQEEQSEEVQLVQEEHEEVQLVQEEQREEVQLVQEEQSEEVQLVQEEQSEEVQLVQEEQSEEVQLVQEEHEEVQLVQEEQREEVQLVQEEQREEVQLVQEEQSEEVQLVQEEQSEEVQLVQEEHEEVQLVQEEHEEVQLVQEEHEEVQLVQEEHEEVQLMQEEHYEEQARTTWEEEVLPLQVVSNCTKKDFQLSQVLISTDVDERCPVVHDLCESNKVLLASDITMTAAQPCLQETGVGTIEADYLSPEVNNICIALETRDTEMESAQKEFTPEVQKGVVMETSGVRDVVRASEGDAAAAAAGESVGESPGCVDPILLDSELRFLTRSPNLMELQALLHSISISSDYVSSVSSAQASTPDLAAGDGLGTCPPTDSWDSFNWEGDVFSEVGHPAWAKSFTGPPPPTDLLDMSLGEEWFDFSSFVASSDAHHSLSSPTAMRPCSMPPSCLVDAAERSEVGTLLERSTGSVGSVETYTAITTAGEGRFEEDEVFKTDSSVFDPYTGVTSADNAGVATTDTYTTSDKAGVATTDTYTTSDKAGVATTPSSAGDVIQHCTSPSKQSSNMADLQEHTSAILCVPHTTVQTKKNLDPPTGSALSNTAVHSPVDVVSHSQYNSISHGAQPVHSSPPYSGPEHQSILTTAAGFWLEQGATSNTNFGPQEMAERGMPVSETDQQAAAPDAKESPVRAEIVEGSPGMSVGPSGACSEKTSGAGGCSLPRRALVPYHLLDRQKRLQPGTISHKTSYLVDYLIFQGGGAHMNQISQVFHENYIPMVKSFSRVSVKFFQDIQEYFIVYEVRGGHFVRLRTLSYAPDASVIMEVKKCGFIAAVCHALAYEEEGLTLSKLKRMPLLMQSLMSLGADMSQLLKACPDFFTVSGSVDGNCCFVLTPRAAKAQREFLPRDRRSLGGTHRDKKPQSAMQVASSFVLSCKAVPVPVAATDACGEKRSVKSGMPLEDGMDEENCKEKPKVLCDKVPLGDHGKDGDGKVSKERSVLEWTVCKDVPRKGRYWKDRGRRDRDGKDKGGRDRDGKDRGGKDRDGRDRDGKDRGGRDRDGKDSGGRDRDGKDRGGRDRGGKRSEEQSVPKSTDMPCDKEDEKRPKERSSTGKKVTFQIDTKK